MKTLLASLQSTLLSIRSASRAVAALQAGVQPDREDLNRLGMDPAAFSRFGRA